MNNNATQSSLKKSAGEVLLAREWNSLVDRQPVSTNGVPAGYAALDNTKVAATNSSGANVAFGECLILSKGTTPAEPVEFYQSVLSVDNPTWPSDMSRLVIAAEPIPDGEVGQVIVAGMCWALAGGTYSAMNCWAMLDPADTKQLMTSTGGMARVFDADSGYALIQLGCRADLWRYELTQDSQAPGITTAKLLTLTGSVYSSSINLSDPESYMADQLSGDTGHCVCRGNGFEAIQAPCTV